MSLLSLFSSSLRALYDGGISPGHTHLLINRVSYMSAHVLLNLLNELGKRDQMRVLKYKRNDRFSWYCILGSSYDVATKIKPK